MLFVFASCVFVQVVLLPGLHVCLYVGLLCTLQCWSGLSIQVLHICCSGRGLSEFALIDISFIFLLSKMFWEDLSLSDPRVLGQMVSHAAQFGTGFDLT